MTGQEVTFDSILEKVGERGYWQLRLFLLSSIVVFFAGTYNTSVVFLAAVPDHWCALPNDTTSTSTLIHEQHSRPDPLWIPVDSSTNKTSRCRRMKTPGGPPNETVACDRWLFSHEEYTSTIVTEWNLVCHRVWLKSLSQAIIMVGILIGTLTGGICGNTFGKARVIKWASPLALVVGLPASFVQHYSVFLLLRMLNPMINSAIFSCFFLLCMENVGKKWRSYMGFLYQIPFSVGQMALPGVAYYFRGWRQLQMFLSLPCVFLLFYCWLVPESPRWLLLKGRNNEALAIMKKMAKDNGRSNISEQTIKDLLDRARKVEATDSTSTDNSYDCSHRMKRGLESLYLLVSSRKMILISVVNVLNWVVASTIYYGVVFDSAQMTASPYWAVFLAGAVELPAYLISAPLLNWLGRRWSTVLTYMVSAVSILSLLVLPEGIVWPKLVMGAVGKFGVSACFAIIYIYTAECMPTNVRNLGFSLCSTFGRFGSASAPFIVDMLATFHSSIPSVIFASSAGLAALLTLLVLPETTHVNLPETVEQINLGHFSGKQRGQDEK